MKGGSKTGDPSINGNFGFVIFESVDTAHKVLKSRVSIIKIKTFENTTNHFKHEKNVMKSLKCIV